MTKRLNLKKLLIAALLLIGVAFVQTAFAQTTWSVSITDTGNPCKFKIERTGDISQAVTVKYRTVSLSAFEGQHFTAVSGDVTFQADDYEKFIDVAESTPIDSAYMFQNGTSRSYRFEVTDMGGFYLTRCDRTKTTGTSVPSSGAFDIKDVTINSGEITVTHGGYDQAFHPMTVGNYFNNAAPRPYLQYIGAQLHMTLSFQCKEIDDGWQYVQIYANQETSNIDPCGDGGDPGACTFSKYAAGFEHKHGSKDPEYKSYTFPVTTVGNVGAPNPWGHGTGYNLHLQRFNNSRASDGRLIIPTNLTSLYIRYNASGSGGDDWVAKNTVAHIQAVDTIAPTISTNNIKVAGGIHGYGNTVYISVPFTEIVTVSGTPTLTTTWGGLSYISGSGSNVLTFSGTITANVGTSLTVRSISGTVKDLADNPYNTNTAINKSFGLTVERPWPGSGSQSDPYIITNAMQLDYLAYEVWRGNSYHGTYFKLGADIDMNGADFLGIGGIDGDYAFSGTFDGDGKTVSNVVVNRRPFSDVGFFGRLSDATVKNLVLDNISIFSIFGSARVGILAGRADNSSIENCLVMNSNVSSNDSNYVGIIAGYPSESYFSANYYHGCTYCGTANATNVGVGSEFSSPYDIDGARSVHTLTLPEYVIATSAETVTYNQVTYYASNVSVTLTPDQGFTLEAVSVNGTTATNNSDGTWSFTMPAEDATVTASMGVLYIDEKGDEQTCTDFTAVSSSYAFGDDNGTAILGVDDATERWYAVVGTVSLDKPLNVYGNARLILCDGAALNLNINAVYNYAAFNIPASNGSDFTIYGQAQGTGTLRVTNTRGRAIDITKNTTINGGSVIASSKHGSIGIRDTLTINRGTVTATSESNGINVSGTITQNGGTLNATGDDSGIQLSRGTLTQNGGTLNATSNYTGNYTTSAGIYVYVYSTVNILGGTLSATGTGGADGIRADMGSTVNILGGIITATGDIGIYAKNSPVYILGGIVNATGSTYGIDIINEDYINIEPIITLGWTTPDDRITASSIHLSKFYTYLQVGDGQTLTDGEGGLYSGTYKGDENDDVFNAMAGKTLQPAYRLTLSGTDFTVTGTTAHQGYAPAGEVVTLHTDEGYHITSASYTPEGGSAIDITPVGDVWSFTMPAEDATVSATVSAATEVPYIDEDGNPAVCTDFTLVSSSYAFGDDNGIAILGVDDATERWYAVVGTVSLDKPLNVYGNARLILCDGAALNINADYNNRAAFNIPASNGSDFTIYGQARQTGTLRVTNSRSRAIDIKKNTTINGGSVIASSRYTGITISDTLTINRGTVTTTSEVAEGISSNGTITQNGGTLNATGGSSGIESSGTLTQNGGTLNATGSAYGIWAQSAVNILGGTFSATGSTYGIRATNDGEMSHTTVNILGGIVTATGNIGIYTDDSPVYILGGILNATGSTYGIDAVKSRYPYNVPIITLGWTTPSDRITASSIHLHDRTIFQVRDGQTLTDGEGGLYSGTYGFHDCDVMAGKTLRGCIVREVAGYGSSTTNGWNLIASPVGTVNLADVPHLFDNQYDLYYFDQTGGSNDKEWKNHKAHCSDAENPFNAMVGGQGYLYANSENVTLLFMGAPYNGNGEVTLTKADGFELSGWNLIGNPFNTAATLDKPFYRMNESGSALTAQVEANNSVAAMEGVFVQASTHNETATFTPLRSPSRGDHRGGVPMLNIHLSQNRGEVIDNAILRFDDGQTLEKFSFRKDSPKIYLPQGGKDYAIATVGRDARATVGRDAARHVSTNEVPVNFDAKENGTYTLSFNFDGVELEYLHLIDNMTGADVDLLPPLRGGQGESNPASYTFAAKTTDYPSRFKLVFSAASTGSAADEAFAYIDASGNIIITADAHGASLQVIDMMGHINVSIDGNTRCVPTAGMTPGVYVLRLINGEKVRTQKIVIE